MTRRPTRPSSDSAPPDPADARWRQAFSKKLVRWFREHQRALPWRETRDPYAIWVSEIMLQQTQVATVIDYYHRFLAAFPTITALADAPEEQVLRQWEGLGYYRRARNLHKAARQIVRDHAGQFPGKIDAVRELPGIGRYTAGAILSIAHDVKLPILEANTVRLYARLLGFEGDPRSGEGQRTLWEAAESWLPPSGTGEFNQALMELGSLICTPRAPKCLVCPVAELCVARRKGLVDRIPRAAAKPVFESVREASIVVRRRGRVLLLKNPEGGRWAGLWDFPRYKMEGGEADAAEEIARLVRERIGVEVGPPTLLKTLKHGVTRFRITLECYVAEWVSGPEACPVKGTLKWIEPAKLEEYPLSVTGRKLARAIPGED